MLKYAARKIENFDENNKKNRKIDNLNSKGPRKFENEFGACFFDQCTRVHYRA